MDKEELNRLILEQIEKISDNVEYQNDDNLYKEIQGWPVTNEKLTVTSQNQKSIHDRDSIEYYKQELGANTTQLL